ncbi:hypothetical protein HK099_004491 [Clydaea vesicula]|uniref:peptidyl-tRNA hydrolase n=1 Tax=Clydaea vesicula TaxID=447962 RepID=A0AAD5XVK4_9FUNG|nr:hypothetical protein HK099_004491 [Clydaea vesicula]
MVFFLKSQTITIKDYELVLVVVVIFALGLIFGYAVNSLLYVDPAEVLKFAERRKQGLSKKFDDPPNPDSKISDETKLFKSDNLKMVLVVRSDLGMTKVLVIIFFIFFKITLFPALKFSHAAVAVVENLIKQNSEKALSRWSRNGATKVALRLEPSSESELLSIYNKARSSGIPTQYICDAGRTQIAAGSMTVCALGPGISFFSIIANYKFLASASMIDEITGHLKLL